MHLRNLRSPSAAVPPERSPPSPEYDGRAAFPRQGTAAGRTGGERPSPAITGLIVLLPFLTLGPALWLLWGRLTHPVEVLLVLLAAVLYPVTGLGVTVAFHLRLTQRRARPARSVRRRDPLLRGLGRVRDVRWPIPDRIAARRV